MTFDAYQRSLELCRSLVPVITTFAARDTSLADQLRRAVQSIPLNVSEANRRVNRDRANRFRIACGSADEVRACLDVGVAMAYVDRETVAAALALVDRVVAMTYRLSR